MGAIRAMAKQLEVLGRHKARLEPTWLFGRSCPTWTLFSRQTRCIQAIGSSSVLATLNLNIYVDGGISSANLKSVPSPALPEARKTKTPKAHSRQTLQRF